MDFVDKSGVGNQLSYERLTKKTIGDIGIASGSSRGFFFHLTKPNPGVWGPGFRSYPGVPGRVPGSGRGYPDFMGNFRCFPVDPGPNRSPGLPGSIRIPQGRVLKPGGVLCVISGVSG
jgi:hypothetical protein